MTCPICEPQERKPAGLKSDVELAMEFAIHLKHLHPEKYAHQDAGDMALEMLAEERRRTYARLKLECSWTEAMGELTVCRAGCRLCLSRVQDPEGE